MNLKNKKHFIHIPKTGGMSIRKAKYIKNFVTFSKPLFHKSLKYTKDLDKTMQKYGEHHGYEHARWRDLNKEVHSRNCFAIVRNPWSKVVSRYNFLQKIFKNKGSESYKNVMKNPSYYQCSFEEFLEWRHIWGNVPFFWHRAINGWYLQKDYVTDKTGILRCDIMRTEHLAEDVNKYFNREMNIGRNNVSNVNNKDYRDFYNKKTKKIIADWYGEDIEFFGFKFACPATKNIWEN